MISFNVEWFDEYVVIQFELVEVMDPQQLTSIQPPDSFSNKFSDKGVVLSGRGPIWLFGYLTHFYHPTLFVAIYDPRLKSAIIVETHSLKYKIGDIISLNI